MIDNLKVSIGIDIVSFAEVERLIESERGRNKCFTPVEQNYCNQKRMPIESYAARFAAKEAVLKAFGIGILNGLPLNNIEILNAELGKPQINFSNKVKSYVEENYKFMDIDISLTHSSGVAIAVAVIICKKNSG